ncbi:MAG: PAS domain-containing protein [Microcystaceae cyanobacterium]
MNTLLEAKVQERTKKLQLQNQVLKEVHDSVITTDVDGTILSWNAGAEQLYGYTRAEALGRNIGFVYQDVQELQTKVLEPLLSQGKHKTEVMIVSKSGRLVDVSLRLSVVKDEQGNITHLIGCASDITERKRAKKALQQLNEELEIKVLERTQELAIASERLSLALKSGAIGCWDLDLADNSLYWDDRMYEIYGVDKQAIGSVVYENWAERLHPEDRPGTERLLQQAILGEAEYNTEFRIIHPDGSTRFIKAYGTVSKDEQGQPQRMIGINFDISDRKKVEQEMLESRRLVQQIADSSPNVLYLYDL